MDIKTAKKVIQAAILGDDTVLMEGLHGIGKSNIVKQFAEEGDYYLEELFLSHQEVGDLIGIPHTVEMDGNSVTTWSIPIWLQRMNTASKAGKKCILFLDELNRAPIDVRQSALQLVLERKIHEHSLPVLNGERTFVISAINPPDDYQVDELDPALIDRFLYIQIEVDAPVWLDYALKTNINSVIRDFISEFPNRLHWTPADGGIGATPRSWVKLSHIMDKVDQIDNDILMHIMKAKVGVEVAAQLYTFYNNYVDVIKVKDIEKIIQNNKDTTDSIEELSGLISKLMQKTEAIQKSDLANQIADKYMKKKDIFPLLTYLYSLEVEICVAFLKSYRQDEPNNYKRIAEIDNKLNNKKLFTRIVQAAEKE